MQPTPPRGVSVPVAGMVVGVVAGIIVVAVVAAGAGPAESQGVDHELRQVAAAARFRSRSAVELDTSHTNSLPCE